VQGRTYRTLLRFDASNFLPPGLSSPNSFTSLATCFYTSLQFICSYTDEESLAEKNKNRITTLFSFGVPGWGGESREGWGGLNIGKSFLVVFVAVMMVAGVHSTTLALCAKHNSLSLSTREENSSDNLNVVISETYNTP